jgi:putative ABC transport system permease protein
MLRGTPPVGRWVDDLRQDLRYALRTLGNSPGFTTIVTLTLAIGIGANTAIFSLVNTILLRELPVTNPADLVFIRTASDRGLGGAPPYPYFERIRDEGASFSGMAAFAADELRVEVDGSVEQVFGQVASGAYFQLLGVTPAAGRLLTPDDERLDPPVAVIGYGYWQRRFGGAPDAIGSTLSFRNRAFTIVGVTPPPFQGLGPGRQVDVTLPITLESAMLANVEAQWFNAVARLRPGVDARRATAQANASFQVVRTELNRAGRTPTRFDRIELTPASRGLDQLRARFSGPLYAMTLVTGILLLIACANLGGLLLVRGALRTRELALRLATGASAGRLLRQVLTETLLLFVLGAAAGLFVAYVAIEGLTGFFATGRRPILLDVQYDWGLVTYAMGVTLATGVLTGVWPALRASRIAPQTAMKEHETRLAGSQRSRARQILVAGQVALSLALLVAAALFARTMVNLRAVDLGFDSTGVLTMSLDPALPSDDGTGAREQMWNAWLERVRGLPGVRSASLSVLTPLSGRNTGTAVSVPGLDVRGEVRLNHVSEDYFRTFGIDMLDGRTLTRQDATGAVKVVVLNETAARMAFAGRPPLGERVEIGDAGLYQVVGVVRDHRHLSVREAAQPFAFVPLRQPVNPISRLTLSVSSAAPDPMMARAVADAIRAIHPNTLVSDVIGVEAQIDATLVSERLLSMLATGFATLVLALAAIGLYGIVSYAAAARTTEFGLRLALGAPRSRVAIGVIGEAMLPVAAGIGIGLPLALAIARAAQRLLFGVTPADATSYLVGAGALIVVAAAAAWLPAWRACALDPAETLRRG